jgi:hypothetical protein
MGQEGRIRKGTGYGEAINNNRGLAPYLFYNYLKNIITETAMSKR